jgi:RNA polymerase sigma factor (sigma-70 family)
MPQPDEVDVVRAPCQEVESALLASHASFLAFIERRVGSRAIAEEVLQTAFVRAIEHGLPAGDEEGSVKWFYAVLRNAITDHHRRAGAESRALAKEADFASSDSADPDLHAAVCTCMHGILPTLRPEYADILREVDLHERTVADVAKASGLTPNNASVRLHRARAAMKKQLERSCGACATHGCLDCSCGTSSKPAAT